MPLLKTLCKLTIALACASATAHARAELLKVSPFLPPAGAANTPTQNAPLEYRGSMQIGNVEQFRVVDPAKKIGVWLKVGEHDANLDVSIKRFDPNQDTIVLDHGGQTMTLQMKKPKVAPGGFVSSIPPPSTLATQMNVSPAVIQTVVPNPTPADEQRRLEAVAAEVARRRALREQAAQQAQMQARAQAQAAGMGMQPQPQTIPRPQRAR